MKKVTFLIVLLAFFFSWYGTAQITSYPYSEDFEAGAGGWVATNGTNGTWALGTPAATIINSAASGANAWATNLTGNYNASDNSFVQSPVFDLSTLVSPSVEFSVWWDAEFSWDGMVLQSSINSGTTWQNVGGLGDPNNWYTDNTIGGNPGGQQVGWSGTAGNSGSNGWRVARHALTGLAGQSNVILRFAFGSDTSGQNNGVSFDLVSIFEVSCPEPTNLTVDSIMATDVNLSWTAGGAQGDWQFINQLDGTAAPTNAVSGTSISTNFVSIMNLTEGEDYDFYVRTDCGSGEFSSWVGPLNYAISGPGETCGNPIMVTTPLPYVTTDNTSNYSDDYSGSPGTTCGSTNGYLNGDDVVYAYTPTADTLIDIKLSNLSDTYAGVFVYNDCAAIGVSCLTGATNGFAQTNLLIDNFAVTAGQTYYIVISTWASPQSVGYTLTITENTCVDPVVAYEVVGDCEVAPQFYVEVDLSDLGSATSISMTDNQGNAAQTTSVGGQFNFGPYPNATDVVITVANTDDANCTLTSPTLSQEFCQDFVVDCAVGPETLNYCYDNNGATTPVIFTFTSSDGNSLNLTFNAGTVENGWDELVVIDTNGSFIVNPADLFYGNNGNLAGLTYQSTGDTISFYINSDSSGSCQLSGYTPIDVSVSCATCTNPTATYAVRGDCLTAPQFFVDVDITDLGSASSLTVTDNQGSAPQNVTTTGLISFGPFPNATSVQITVTNDNDANCLKISEPLTQPFCLENLVDCTVGPLNVSYCYSNSDTNLFSYVSSDGSLLNLTINSGTVENGWDALIIYDSDGVTELYNGEGNAGDISGLTFQSTGDTIYFSVASDGIFSCEDGSIDNGNGINYTVACATCINPAATYAVIDDCANGQQFFIDVNVTSLGDATSVTVTDNQGSAGIQVTADGTVQFGPYPFATPIIITISNDQDVNCVINSAPIQVAACPPANDNCAGATVAVVNQNTSCDLITAGTILAATPSGVPASSCGGNANDDVWFQFTALHEVELISILNIAGGTENLDFALYSGSCGTLTEVSCSTDVANFTPDLIVGNIYYVRVFSFDSVAETSTFNLCIKAAPTNLVCENAVNFCGNNGALFTDSIVGVPDVGAIACLSSVQNPAWNIIQIGESGQVNLQISQNTEFDANGNPIGQGLDVDYALWGPFASLEDACGNLTLGCPDPDDCPGIPYTPEFYPYGNIIDCSWSIASIETATIDNAIAGEIYVLLVSNYSNNPGTIQIQQTNSGTTGAGSTVAEIQVDLGGDQEFCGVDSLVITASSPFADTYEWYADGFVIDGETGQTLTVTESNTYTVIVYDTQCGSFAQDTVAVTLGLEAVANPVSNIVTCDDITGDDVENFDLDAQTTAILGTQDPSLFNVTYHLSQSDAITNTGALTSPYTNISNPQTIWVRVEDANSPNCSARTSFDLVISGSIPSATSVDIEVCQDASGNGTESFDLVAHALNILNGQSPTDFTVSYYISQENAEAGVSPLASPYTNTTSPQTIWARVDNNTSVDCYTIVDFDLMVSPLPVTSFTTNFDYEVCPDATVPVIITATPENYSATDVSIVWYEDGEIISGQSGLTLPVLRGGTYTIEVTFNETGCRDTASQDVVELEICEFPQGISPGVSPGLNDTFDLSNFNVKRIEIFNRLGTLVYSKDNYTDEWHGQADNGDELPVGTYFYTVTYEGGAKIKSAWVYLNK